MALQAARGAPVPAPPALNPFASPYTWLLSPSNYKMLLFTQCLGSLPIAFPHFFLPNPILSHPGLSCHT